MDGIVERFTSKIEPYDCWRSKQGNQLMKSNKFRKPIGSRRFGTLFSVMVVFSFREVITVTFEPESSRSQARAHLCTSLH